MSEYLVNIKAGANFKSYSRRNNNPTFNLQLDEDVFVNVPQGINFMINNQIYRLGNRKKVNNNFEPLLPINFNIIILKKDTKYFNNNYAEDELGFTKKLELDQKVIFCNEVLVEFPAGTPFHTLDGNLEFTINCETYGYFT